MSALECRTLFAAVTPSNNEQYLVELINRGRADPAAEAVRYGIDLNEGVASRDTITTDPKQPLAINPSLTDAARQHSEWMIGTDQFAHVEPPDIDPGDRMTAAGYDFTGNWTWGENIAEIGGPQTTDVAATAAQLHANLFIDAGIDGRGHRTNLMNGAFREIGAGIQTGDFKGLNAVMATEDFGTTGTSAFLTGVAYDDNAVSKDNFYTPGEGLGGIAVTARRAGDNAVFSTTTWSSGGYSLAVPAGSYTVSANGAALGGTVTYGDVVVGTQNVKKDFTPAQIDSTIGTVADGVLTIVGTPGDDAIGITYDGNTYTVTRNAAWNTFAGAGIAAIGIYGDDGNDSITVGPGIMGVYVDAGPGNDNVIGGDGNDMLSGGGGKDRVDGGLGDDRVSGNKGIDQLFGGAGRDRLYGGDSADTLDGGSSGDRLWGDDGSNTYIGGNGDDRIYARQNLPDTLWGGRGIDHAQMDAFDTYDIIEDIMA
jgi:uncharacterized protein YkwD